MIRNATKNDVADIIGISTEVFGPNYLKESHIYFESDRSTCIVEESDQIIAFGFGKLLDQENFDILFKNRIVPEDLILANKQGKLGIIKTLGVKQQFQGQGYGSKIIHELQARIITKGARRIIVPAWKQKDVINVEKIMTKANYEPFLEIKDMWKVDCDSEKFKCPARSDKCVCSLIYYQDTNTID